MSGLQRRDALKQRGTRSDPCCDWNQRQEPAAQARRLASGKNDIARCSGQLSPRRQAETSALDKEAGGLQREHLIRGAEIRRLNSRCNRYGGIEIPSQDYGDHEGDKERPRVGTVALWIARNLSFVRNRHMQMAAALVLRVEHCAEWTMLLARTAFATAYCRTPVGFAVVTRRENFRFVFSAVSNGDAQHPPGSQRDHPLHHEQEDGNEFDDRRGHLIMLSVRQCIPLQSCLGSFWNLAESRVNRSVWYMFAIRDGASVRESCGYGRSTHHMRSHDRSG